MRRPLKHETTSIIAECNRLQITENFKVILACCNFTFLVPFTVDDGMTHVVLVRTGKSIIVVLVVFAGASCNC